ncbi:MAG TPA: cupin domain-containing protein [Pyrinomonadaceae bacterium]|nr:cupin domain-containing protein [Pyrinomonadaceae bacterium]
MIANLVRLYASADGESHFEDTSAELNLVDLIPSAPPLYISESSPASEFSFFGAPAGWQSDWHPSNNRNLFFVISGEWEVTASDGETRKFSAGDALLVEDTTGKGHQSKVTISQDSVSILIRL